MPSVIVFDEGASPQQVLRFITSISEHQYQGRSDVKIYSDRTTQTEAIVKALVASVGRKYLKVVGDDTAEMNGGEKNAVDAAEVAAIDANLRAVANSLYNGQQEQGQALRALVKVLLDEINTLRALHSLGDRTLAQAKTAIQGAIDAGDVDE